MDQTAPGMVSHHAAVTARRTAFDRTLVAFVALLIVTTALRFVVGVRDPLWLDETFTGAVARQPSFHDFWQQVMYDQNAPLYYLLAFLWSKVAGLSNIALRFPAALFGCATPFVALTASDFLDRRSRFLWCALLALWWPAIWSSQEARGITLLFFFGAINTVVFVRLLRRPTLLTACVWMSVSSLLFLTHYYSAIILGVQGVVYLATRRWQAVRTWPAVLLFLPGLAWFYVNIPRILTFHRPDTSWYNVLRADGIIQVGQFVLSSYFVLPLFALWLAIGVGLYILRRNKPAEELPAMPWAVWASVACSYIAIGIVVLVGYLKPTYSSRYLTPFIPGALLGIALLARALRRRWSEAYIGLMAIYILTTSFMCITYIAGGRRDFGFETASDYLMRDGVNEIVFFWDNPNSKIEVPAQLEAVGGFFYGRAGRPVKIDPVYINPWVDANPILVSMANAPKTGIIWIYDQKVPATSARWTLPRIDKMGPNWHCHDFSRRPDDRPPDGGPHIGIVACDHAAVTPSAVHIASGKA